MSYMQQVNTQEHGNGVALTSSFLRWPFFPTKSLSRSALSLSVKTRVAFSRTSPNKRDDVSHIKVKDTGTHDRGRPGIATGCIELVSSLDGALNRGD